MTKQGDVFSGYTLYIRDCRFDTFEGKTILAMNFDIHFKILFTH